METRLKHFFLTRSEPHSYASRAGRKQWQYFCLLLVRRKQRDHRFLTDLVIRSGKVNSCRIEPRFCHWQFLAPLISWSLALSDSRSQQPVFLIFYSLFPFAISSLYHSTFSILELFKVEVIYTVRSSILLKKHILLCWIRKQYSESSLRRVRARPTVRHHISSMYENTIAKFADVVIIK